MLPLSQPSTIVDGDAAWLSLVDLAQLRRLQALAKRQPSARRFLR
jgi:hypothetical protein